jgi:uncharacterized small protein (DUF1192 family)
VEIEDDILDLIRALPNEVNDASTTTEMKFLTVGSVLWQCHHEIKFLREEVARLKRERSRQKGKKVY